MRRIFLQIWGVLLLTGLICLAVMRPRIAIAANDYMFLTVTDYETGISYRQAQWHAPIGHMMNPCSYADHFEGTIDWNDGTGEHKPATNVEVKVIQKTTPPAVLNGVYLFWDDEHVWTRAGTQVVTTKLVVHCQGDPPGDRVYIKKNTVNVYPRIVVKRVEFTKNGKSTSSVKGHDSVDLTITLDAPAPPSGTWVNLEVTPPGNLNSLPPYFLVSAQLTEETVANLEVRKPDANLMIQVTGVTVGRPQESQRLTITP
jgi:hypothetical protein